MARVAGLKCDKLPEGHVILREPAILVVVAPIIRAIIKHDLVDRALRKDDIILLPELECPEHRVDRAGSKVHKEALVTLTILEMVIHLLVRLADTHLDIAVAKDDDSTSDRIATLRHVLRFYVTHAHHIFFHILHLG